MAKEQGKNDVETRELPRLDPDEPACDQRKDDACHANPGPRCATEGCSIGIAVFDRYAEAETLEIMREEEEKGRLWI